MPTNSESLNRELYRLLTKYKPKPLDAEGKTTPVPEEADVFKFEFTKDGDDYGTVYVTLDEDRVLTVYFGDDVSDSPSDRTPGIDYDDTWTGLLQQLSAWRMTKGLRGFKTQNKDRVNDDMAKRNHMRNKDKIAEGYYPMGKKASYSDAIPTVKIVIEHSRVIEEGEKRYRNINKIFLENLEGERYLLDTKKPGVARVYARHIAEGGKVNDDRWNHVHSLCEEYSKMAGFVRATRNGQFNESAQALVNEGLEHYQSLRESLSRMTGKRGYNAYFENWTPSLMEDGTEENNLNELFVQETLDPRIESVMPILNRIHKKVSESVVDKEMNKLAEWADSLVEDESIKSNNPVGIPEGKGDFSQAIEQLSGWDEVEPYEPGTRQYDFDDDEGGYYAQGTVVQDLKTGQIKIEFKDDGEYGGHEINDTFNSIGDAMNALRNITRRRSKSGRAQNFDTLGGRSAGSDDVYKTDKIGKKGTLKKVRMDTMKASSPYRMRGGPKGVLPEEVDLGQYDAVKPISNSGPTPEQEKEFRKKVQAYGKELEQRQKEKEKGVAEGDGNPDIRPGMKVSQGTVVKVDGNTVTVKTSNGDMITMNIHDVDQAVAEDLDANQKRVGQLGPTEKVGPKGAVGKLVGANENFINTVDQAVVSEEDEMAEGVLDAIKRGVAGAKQFGKEVKDATKQAWDEEIPKLKQDWKNPIKTAFAEEDEMDEGVLDGIKNMFGKKDQKLQTPIAWDRPGSVTPEDILIAYQREPDFTAYVKNLAMQHGISPKEVIKQLQQSVGPLTVQPDYRKESRESFPEGAHTQHYDAANKFTGDIDHGERPPTDWSTDPIEAGTDRIHNKISSMLKKLSKPKDTQDLDEATAPWEDEDEAENREKENKEPKDKKGSDGSEHGGHSRAKHLAKQAIPKEKEEVKEGQDELNSMLRLLGEGVAGEFAGGTAGQMAGRELTKEEQLNEFAPLIAAGVAAGARLILPALARVGPILGRMASTAGKAGAEVAGKAATGVGRGAADVAKSAAQSAAQNAGKIGVGAGAYQAITDVANSAVGGVGQIYHDIGSATSAIAQAVGNSIDKATIAELATAAVKYAIPVGILLALLYGGKKLLDQVMGGDAEPAPAGAMVKEGQDDLDRILTIMNHRR